MIATAILYNLSLVHGTKVQQTKVQPNLDVQMKYTKNIHVFGYVSAVAQVKKTRNINALDIHLEDFIKDADISQ